MTHQAPIKILYCENNADGTIGGSYYSLLYLASGLDRSRFIPLVLFQADHKLLGAFRDAGIETIIWPDRFAPITLVTPAKGLFRAVRLLTLPIQKAINFATRLLIPAISRAWFLKARGIDLVHLNNSVMCHHQWMLAARLAGCKCITHERGIIRLYTRTAKYFAKRQDAIICISEAVRKRMQSQGADFGNLEVIYNGLDPSTLQIKDSAELLRARNGFHPDDVIVGMIGNIREWKGQDLLIRAIDTVRKKVPTVRALLVGATASADIPYERTLRELVTALGLTENVLFLGFRENVAEIIKMSDIIAHTSVLPEPFGRVILEAMACKKPIVASQNGAIPEIIVEGETGLTFPPGDAEALANKMLALISDRESMKRLGENGYQRLIERFHSSRNIELTQALYERLMQGTKKSG